MWYFMHVSCWYSVFGGAYTEQVFTANLLGARHCPWLWGVRGGKHWSLSWRGRDVRWEAPQGRWPGARPRWMSVGAAWRHPGCAHGGRASRPVGESPAVAACRVLRVSVETEQRDPEEPAQLSLGFCSQPSLPLRVPFCLSLRSCCPNSPQSLSPETQAAACARALSLLG